MVTTAIRNRYAGLGWGGGWGLGPSPSGPLAQYSLLFYIHSDHSVSQSLVSCLLLRAAAMEVAAKPGTGSAKPSGAMVSLWLGMGEGTLEDPESSGWGGVSSG